MTEKSMKKIIITTALLGIASIAFATSTSPITAPSGMIGTGALDGTYAYTWTVASGALVPGSVVDSASITFTGIKLTSVASGDLNVDLGRVFSGMTAKPSTLPTAGNYGTFTDNDAPGDAFAANITAGNAMLLGKTTLAQNVAQTWTYTFNSAELTALNSYASQGSWGFLIDPDCVFNVGNIQFTYTTAPNGVPDGGTTAMLLGAAMLGLGWAKRRMGV